jgi:hypothetical protein
LSVTDPQIIDLIGVNKANGELVLTISDHLDWNNSQEHELILQEKLNTYLAFVESGELLERYADAKDRPVVFNVVFKFAPNEMGIRFLAKAKDVIELAGFSLRHEILLGSTDH